jgi:CheY-like chemotaxis protein
MLERVAADRRLMLRFQRGLAAVRVDPSQVEQVVMNLVANAVDATTQGGMVTIRTSSAVVDPDDDIDTAPGRYAVVTVEDDGDGIDETVLHHLFEPFFTTKGVGDGTGLGLATAYGIVKQSGGTIAVHSERGRGARFSIYLPEATMVDGETIFVVERDAAVRDVVFELLTDAGYRVLTASTPGEALCLSDEIDGPIDLLVADFGDGETVDLVETLHRARPSLRTLSLRKPYAPDRLRSDIRLALDITLSRDIAPQSG